MITDEQDEELRENINSLDSASKLLNDQLEGFSTEMDLSIEEENFFLQLRKDMNQLEYTITSYQEFRDWI